MPRFEDKLSNEVFLKKVLTTNELELLNALSAPRRKLEFLCGRYAAKEAYAKALKLGIGKVDFLDFEVLKKDNIPIPNIENVEISISHDGDYAIAIVMVGEVNECI